MYSSWRTVAQMLPFWWAATHLPPFWRNNLRTCGAFGKTVRAHAGFWRADAHMRDFLARWFARGKSEGSHRFGTFRASPLGKSGGTHFSQGRHKPLTWAFTNQHAANRSLISDYPLIRRLERPKMAGINANPRIRNHRTGRINANPRIRNHRHGRISANPPIQCDWFG